VTREEVVSVLEELAASVATQRRIVSSLEPGCFRGEDALRLLEIFTDIERVGTAGRTLMARRVEESNVWRAFGDRSAAQFIATRTGTTVGRTYAALETAERLEQLPATAEAFRAGKLSETQAEAVASAAAVNPNEERRLLDKAGSDSVKSLRDECLRVKHAATDEQARYETIRRDRHLRTWTDGQGAFCGGFRTTPDAGARILAVLEAETNRMFKQARKEGRREPHQAYAMDALEALLCSGGGAGKGAKFVHEICVLADYNAMVNGECAEGEACEIAGLGPVPVARVQEWLQDAYLRLIVTDGVDIKAISRRSRYVDREQQAALRVRDRTCCIAGCDVTWRLERDHRRPFAGGGPTALDNLDRYCDFHHFLKTKGWLRVGGPGCYRLVPPPGGVSPPKKPRSRRTTRPPPRAHDG
jgi:hypothetical protein